MGEERAGRKKGRESEEEKCELRRYRETDALQGRRSGCGVSGVSSRMAMRKKCVCVCVWTLQLIQGATA